MERVRNGIYAAWANSADEKTRSILWAKKELTHELIRELQRHAK